MTTRFVPAHVRSAIDIVVTDRDRTVSERRAFTSFIDRLSEFSVESIDSKTNLDCSTPVQIVLEQTQSSHSVSQLARVRELYRETVMGVEHYPEEYGDSFDESIAEEFGPEIAAATLNSDQLTPQLRDRLIEASNQARESRHALLQGLENEHNALQSADEALTELGADLDDVLSAHSFQTWPDEELATVRKDLHTRERECDRLAADRQTTLHEQRIPSTHHIDLEFTEYLYRSLPVTFPVLADIASLTETLRTARQNVDHALASETNACTHSPFT